MWWWSKLLAMGMEDGKVIVREKICRGYDQWGLENGCEEMMQWVWGRNESVRFDISGGHLDMEMGYWLTMLEVGCIPEQGFQIASILPLCTKPSRVANTVYVYFQWWLTAAIISQCQLTLIQQFRHILNRSWRPFYNPWNDVLQHANADPNFQHAREVGDPGGINWLAKSMGHTGLALNAIH